MTLLSTQAIVTAIVAMSENRVIGQDNRLPWHLPADLKRFKALTMGHPIIMGRKTHQSIGRALPGRLNIVLSRDSDFTSAGVTVLTAFDQALTLAANNDSSEIFIMGGAQIYHLALPMLQRIYLTIVHHSIDGDAFFPPLNPDDWQEIARDFHAADANHAYGYSFVTLEKR